MTQHYSILSLFPEILQGYFESSLMAKACGKGILSYDLVNIRDFSVDKHKKCDDAPYGGGSGMVLKPEPLAAALDSVCRPDSTVIYMTPSGSLFNQKKAWELSKKPHLTIICGRYEGIDQRIIDLYVHEEISIGDYVLSSGEVAAMVLVDAVYRLREGVITASSLHEESFSDGLLEYPHYTRPEDFRGRKVPEILLGGNHAAITSWRKAQSQEKTKKYRPDLLQNH